MKKHNARNVRSGLLLLALGMSANGMAQDGKALYSEKGCAACHGPTGDEPIMPSYPKLGGQNVEYAVQQMQDIKSGARDNGQSATMKPMVANISEEEMTAIAEFLANQ